MARRPGRPPAGSEPLTRARVVVAALAIVDRDGMAALTIRRLAADLGVDPMAIYHHVPGKDALVTAVVEAVFAGMALPPAEIAPWPDRVRGFAYAYRGVVRSHPNLIRHVVAHAAAVPAAWAAGEAAYAALAAAGLPPEAVVRGVDLLIDWVHGFALAEADHLAGGGAAGGRGEGRGVEAGRQAMATRLAENPDRSPTMRQVVSALPLDDPASAFATVEADLDASFAFGLDVIVAGLATIAAQGRWPKPA